MQRFVSWGLPLYAIVLTGVLASRGVTDNPKPVLETREPAPCQESRQVAVVSEPSPASHTGYPVPPPLKQPKHLFHLVIRYEGDGIIDQNVVEACKPYLGNQSTSAEAKKPTDKPATPKPASSNLFQFIVRYEGDGIIDNNVVDFFKAYVAAQGTPTATPTPAVNTMAQTPPIPTEPPPPPGALTGDTTGSTPPTPGHNTSPTAGYGTPIDRNTYSATGRSLRDASSTATSPPAPASKPGEKTAVPGAIHPVVQSPPQCPSNPEEKPSVLPGTRK